MERGLLISAVLFLLLNAGNSEIIDTPQGQIQGVVKTARNGQTFTGFYGVPFAQPPVGQLRFHRPQPADTWEGVRSATSHGNECLYHGVDDPTKLEGDEDCLYLNVFTRHPGDVNAKKNVLVWIHGGAFIFGGAQLYNPEYIMEEDVVLVVIQYRLNIFGFLSTEDEHLPGNMGSFDQVEAFKWVQKNIHSYGGDPDKVTAFGMSAGGASVHYLMLSPHAKGLFKNAISFSGSSLNWWAHIRNPKEQALKLANHFQCDTQSSETIAECLRKLPAKELARSQDILFEWRVDNPSREPMNVFSPRWDPEAKDPFMPEHPLIMMEKGRINPANYLLGYAEKEGGWRANYIMPDNEDGELWKDFTTKFDELGQLALGLFGKQAADPQGILNLLKEYYDLNGLGEGEITEDKAHAYIDVQSDSMFTFGIDVTAKLHAQTAKHPTYFYYLKYPGEHTLTNFRTDHSIRKAPIEALRYATHGTDMLLMFPMFPFDPMPDEDVRVSRDFIRLILDFAQNGKFTTHPDWDPLNLTSPEYLNIDKEFTVQKGLPYQDKVEFWQKLNVYWNFTLQRTTATPNKSEL